MTGKHFHFLLNSLLFLLISIGFELKAQNAYPQDYFIPPFEGELLLAGSFGELRSNHFHSGIDIKTDGKEGKPVRACADGYVSRVKVSPYGFGHALYIAHPNGYTTVYAHLLEFSEELQEYVREQQYKNRSFAIDLYPDAGQFKFKQGDTVALSGNSGGSSGPHLHFEIRNSADSKPLNPLLFGIEIKDDIAPVISSVIVYPKDGAIIKYISQSNPENIQITSSDTIVLPVKKVDGIYKPENLEEFCAKGEIGIAVQTEDRHNGSYSRLGIYELTMKKGDELIHEHNLEGFYFHESRYINSHTDYRQKVEKGSWFQKCFTENCNNLSIYKVSQPLNIEESNKLSIMVRDANNNRSQFEMDIAIYDEEFIPESFSCDNWLECGRSYTLKTEGATVVLSSSSLYNKTCGGVKSESSEEYYSRIIKVLNPSIPCHDRFSISIEADISLELQSKACIVNLNSSKPVYEGGTYKNGAVHLRTREFGEFAVTVDNKAPEITPLSYIKLNEGHKLRFNCEDDLSGLQSYDLYIDGEWRLLEYDAKNDLLYHYIDKKYDVGEHELKLIVTDDKENKTVFTRTFKT